MSLVKELWREFDRDFGKACPPPEAYRLKGAFYCGVGACLHLFLQKGSDDLLVEDMAEKLKELVQSIQKEMEDYYVESPFKKPP